MVVASICLRVEEVSETLRRIKRTQPKISFAVFCPGPFVFDRRSVLFQSSLVRVSEPARVFLLGADGSGRDQFSRLLVGGQISLLAGILATILSLLIGTAMGAAAGFFGKWADGPVMRLTDLFLALPWLYLLLAVRAFLRSRSHR